MRALLESIWHAFLLPSLLPSSLPPPRPAVPPIAPASTTFFPPRVKLIAVPCYWGARGRSLCKPKHTTPDQVVIQWSQVILLICLWYYNFLHTMLEYVDMHTNCECSHLSVSSSPEYNQPINWACVTLYGTYYNHNDTNAIQCILNTPWFEKDEYNT